MKKFQTIFYFLLPFSLFLHVKYDQYNIKYDFFGCMFVEAVHRNLFYGSVRSFGLVVFLRTVNIVLTKQVSQPFTCNFDLCDRPVSTLCVRSDLHHVVSICMQGEVYVSFIGCVQDACGVSLFPVQDLKENIDIF